VRAAGAAEIAAAIEVVADAGAEAKDGEEAFAALPAAAEEIAAAEAAVEDEEAEGAVVNQTTR
jgi:hypothetical protein